MISNALTYERHNHNDHKVSSLNMKLIFLMTTGIIRLVDHGLHG